MPNAILKQKWPKNDIFAVKKVYFLDAISWCKNETFVILDRTMMP